MLREAIDRLLQLGKPTLTEVGDHVYTTEQLKRVEPPQPTALRVGSLQAILDYFTKVKDTGAERFFVHIESPMAIGVESFLSDGPDRWTLLYVTAHDAVAPMVGKFQPVESFIIWLLTCFTATEERATVLRLVGNIRSEKVATQADDGVTQTVTARAGITTVENVQVPNPVHLAGYRTFREVAQPKIPYVLRLREAHGGVEAGLFEADGKVWYADGVANIKGWLTERLPDSVAVIG